MGFLGFCDLFLKNTYKFCEGESAAGMHRYFIPCVKKQKGMRRKDSSKTYLSSTAQVLL